MLLTLPRWYGNHHPLNLAVVARPRELATSAPTLAPFPSWEAQALGDCSALQFALGLAVDRAARALWIPDNGRELRSSRRACPAKLVRRPATPRLCRCSSPWTPARCSSPTPSPPPWSPPAAPSSTTWR